MRELADLLKTKDLKVTPQRLAIYNLLYHTKEHPSAEAIYEALQPIHPTMSLATVYKTLDAFKKAGLINELNTGGASVRYDADVEAHAHAVCTECETIFDVYANEPQKLTGELQVSEEGFKVIGHKLYLYGLCADCQNAGTD